MQVSDAANRAKCLRYNENFSEINIPSVKYTEAREFGEQRLAQREHNRTENAEAAAKRIEPRAIVRLSIALTFATKRWCWLFRQSVC